MFTRTRRTIPLVVILAAVGALLSFGYGGSNTVAQAPMDLEKTALERVAERYGVPISALVVSNSTMANYPISGKTAFKFKVADTRIGGEVYGMTLDSNGAELDAESLQANERAAYAAKYGKLDPALADRLAGASDGELIKVSIWLNKPPYEPQRPDPKSNPGITREQLDQIIKENDARKAAHVVPVVTPVAVRLQALGYEVTFMGTLHALIHARLTPTAIREVAAWSEVKEIYLDEATAQDELGVARPTIYANTVHNRGITGTGIKVAQLD